MTITLYHNPRCSKSRATLALLEEHGHEPEIVRYLDDVPDEDTIRALLSMLGLGARELMRKGEADYRDNGLADEQDEDKLIAALRRWPKLIERPIVVANGKARIGRPPESVLEIL